jgi:hypothetical protein
VNRLGITNTNEVYTAGLTIVPSNATTNDLRFNYTRSTTLRFSSLLNYSGSLKTVFPDRVRTTASRVPKRPESN